MQLVGDSEDLPPLQKQELQGFKVWVNVWENI